MDRKLFFIACSVLSLAYLGCDNIIPDIVNCVPGCLDSYMRVSCAPDGSEKIEMCSHGCYDGQCMETPEQTPDEPSQPENIWVDTDKDGIGDDVELNTCTDPLKLDTDGDGITDGDEDLNRNGIFEPLFGETNPCDNTSKPEPEEQGPRKLICNGNKTDKDTFETYETDEFVHLKLKDAEYKNAKQYTAFRHQTADVVGFFGVANAFHIEHILKTAFPNGQKYQRDDTYINAVPRIDWLKNGTYDAQLQGLPDHVVDRYKYTITLEEGQNLESIQEMLAQTIFGHVITFEDKNMRCEAGDSAKQAILYLARSAYSAENGNQYLYSGALACRSNFAEQTTIAAQKRNILEDTISGTLIAPKGISNEVETYTATEQSICQGEKFSTGQNAVDFLWVVDNSGSMGDELSLLADTIESLSQRLDATGIDYRFAVTTTDAYLIDEQGITENGRYSYDTKNDQTYMPYDENNRPKINAYVNSLGVRTIQHTHPCMIDRNHLQIVKDNIKLYSKNADNKLCPNNLNICGKGYEDGFKSGLMTLERLSLNVDDPKPAEFSQDWWDHFVQRKKHLAYHHYFDTKLCDDAELEKRCHDMLGACQMRTDALKYIVFVSDEDSRQFKEDGIVSPHQSHLNGCLTGYKLEFTNTADVYTMMTGIYAEGMACNPTLKDYKTKLAQAAPAGTSPENMSLAQIRAAYPEYYHILSYYLNQYRKYAGTGRVSAFALVGDAGWDNGGVCQKLATCTDEQCKQYRGDKCIQCGELNDQWNTNDPTATEGAEFGLSYIHLARFLSTVYRDAYGIMQTDGPEGGYATICNNDYNISVLNMIEDLTTRVSSIPMKGYPIASTLRLAMVYNGQVIEVKREDMGGAWRYDALQNAVIFGGLKDIKDGANLIFSYQTWKPIP